MSGQHTPGPWTVRYGSTDVGHCLGVVGANFTDGDEAVCLASSTSDRKPHDEANARLIAAAPELLDALEWFVGMHKQDERRYVQDQVVAAQTVIAKATGRAPC